MSNKHPYVISNGPLIQIINHLRNSFLSKLSSDTLKKLGYAKKNESYVINTLRFIGIIDEEGSKTDIAAKEFVKHADEDFQKGFSNLVKKAYSELFALHSDATWSLGSDPLITFFRQHDRSSAIVGRKQASTFKALAALSGYGDMPEPKASTKGGSSKRSAKSSRRGKKTEKIQLPPSSQSGSNHTDKKSGAFGLTVRVEVNLPAEGDQETYDRIFKSIKENLLNG